MTNMIKRRFIHFGLIACISALMTPGVYAQQALHLNLPQAVDYAIEHNPDMHIMQQRIAQAEAQRQIALSSFYPNIDASLSYQHSDNPSQAFAMVIAQRRLQFTPDTDFNHPGGIDNYRPEIRARYNLFNGGQDYYQSGAAKLGVDAAKLRQEAARQQLAEAVKAGFFAYLAAIEADKVADKSIYAVKTELKQSRNRLQVGAILRSDVLSLEVKLAEAQDKKIQTSNAIAMAKAGLKKLLGLTAQQSLSLDTAEHGRLPDKQNSFVELLQLAEQNRPEAKAAKKQIEIAEHKLNAAKGAYLPTADAYVAYGSDSKNLDFDTGSDNVSAGVTVQVNLFSGFRQQQNIKKAQQQLSIARKNAEQIRLQIENGVKIAHLRLQEALARIDVTTVAVEAAEEAFRLVSEQRKAGVVTVTRYLEAEVARDKSHARQIAARYDALRADAQLQRAVGSWEK